jgi:hypothetical protein
MREGNQETGKGIMAFERDDSYIEVKDRILEFRAKYPEGRLAIKEVRMVDVPASFLPGKTLRNGNKIPDQIVPPQSYVMVIAQAFRTPDDAAPGEGSAWEPIPGRTPYTRDSEVQNAETSAWGRALIALGAADATKGIASAHEVKTRQYTHETWENATPAEQGAMPARAAGGAVRAKKAADETTPWNAPAAPPPAAAPAGAASPNGQITPEQHAEWAAAISACGPDDADDAAALEKKRDKVIGVRSAILSHVRTGTLPHADAAGHMNAITSIGKELSALLGG